MSINLNKYLFGSDTRQMVYKSLDANTIRSRAISQNIANVLTPGYQRKDVDFEAKIREAMNKKISGNTTDPAHFSISRGLDLSKVIPEVYEPQDPTLPGEVNNVDIDMENARMAENQIQYQFNLRFAGFDKYFAAIKGSAN